MKDEKQQNLPDLTVDEWNDVYIEVTQDLNRLLAQQLIEDRNYDEEADFELNQMFSELAIEQQAETLDPANNDSCVCAICKANVARRIRGTRIVCELNGCLDIDVCYPDFRVEDVMIKLCQLIDEHKRQSEEQNTDCFKPQQRGSCCLQLVVLDGDFNFTMVTNDMDVQKENLAFFMECDRCSFLDFTNVF